MNLSVSRIYGSGIGSRQDRVLKINEFNERVSETSCIRNWPFVKYPLYDDQRVIELYELVARGNTNVHYGSSYSRTIHEERKATKAPPAIFGRVAQSIHYLFELLRALIAATNHTR